MQLICSRHVIVMTGPTRFEGIFVMPPYRLQYTDSSGAMSATGVTYCSSDERAIRDARLCLRRKPYWANVRVTEGDRVVGLFGVS